jgi:hypothetical protein
MPAGTSAKSVNSNANPTVFPLGLKLSITGVNPNARGEVVS